MATNQEQVYTTQPGICRLYGRRKKSEAEDDAKKNAHDYYIHEDVISALRKSGADQAEIVEMERQVPAEEGGGGGVPDPRV